MRRIIVVAIAVALGAAVLLIGGLVSRPLAAQSTMSLIGYGPRPELGCPISRCGNKRCTEVR